MLKMLKMLLKLLASLPALEVPEMVEILKGWMLKVLETFELLAAAAIETLLESLPSRLRLKRLKFLAMSRIVEILGLCESLAAATVQVLAGPLPSALMLETLETFGMLSTLEILKVLEPPQLFAAAKIQVLPKRSASALELAVRKMAGMP